MAEKFPKQEEKLVHDNGVLKWLQRTVYMPGDTGMVVVSPTHLTDMRYGNTRVSSSPSGLVPVENTVEVRRRSDTPTETGEYYWVPAQYDGDPNKTIQKGRYLWNLPDVRKTDGVVISKALEKGGAILSTPSKQKRMKELLLIINGAAKELSTKQPGDNVAYLAQVIQDPQEAELIEAIVAEIPDAQEIIDQVSQLSSQMFKCGGKTKKKVKKGAKGCVPCKKLMRVGGKLINVWSDCEGNIISKHQVGGYLIPKGGMGLITNKLLGEKYRQGAVGDGQDGQEHYYMDDAGAWNHQKWNGTKWESVNGERPEDIKAAALAWARGTKNELTGQFENPISDFFVNGFTWNYDNNTGAFLGLDNHKTAVDVLGQDDYGKGNVEGNIIREVKGKTRNKWLYADDIRPLDPTTDDEVEQLGVRGAFNLEQNRFKDLFEQLQYLKQIMLLNALYTRRNKDKNDDISAREVRKNWRQGALAGARDLHAKQMHDLIQSVFKKWSQYSNSGYNTFKPVDLTNIKFYNTEVEKPIVPSNTEVEKPIVPSDTEVEKPIVPSDTEVEKPSITPVLKSGRRRAKLKIPKKIKKQLDPRIIGNMKHATTPTPTLIPTTPLPPMNLDKILRPPLTQYQKDLAWEEENKKYLDEILLGE